jgi:hypothetical protein
MPPIARTVGRWHVGTTPELCRSLDVPSAELKRINTPEGG